MRIYFMHKHTSSERMKTNFPKYKFIQIRQIVPAGTANYVYFLAYNQNKERHVISHSENSEKSLKSVTYCMDKTYKLLQFG